MGFSCGCDDYAEVCRTTEQRARKQYRCGECRQPIMPGVVYSRTFMVFDGDARTEINCERCADLMGAFSDTGYCWDEGEFIRSYSEWLEDTGKKKPTWLTQLFTQPQTAGV